jgi:hypothetical protein
MELESLLAFLQQPVTSPYTEPDKPSPRFPVANLTIHSNIILPPTMGAIYLFICLFIEEFDTLSMF